MSSVVADKVEAVIIIEPMARDGWSPRSRGGGRFGCSSWVALLYYNRKVLSMLKGTGLLW